MGVSLKDCYDSRPIDFTWSTLRDYTLFMRYTSGLLESRLDDG